MVSVISICLLHVCSCGECESDNELKCEEKEYRSQRVLTCEMHNLAYEIECSVRGDYASEITDPELGRVIQTHVRLSHK